MGLVLLWSKSQAVRFIIWWIFQLLPWNNRPHLLYFKYSLLLFQQKLPTFTLFYDQSHHHQLGHAFIHFLRSRQKTLLPINGPPLLPHFSKPNFPITILICKEWQYQILVQLMYFVLQVHHPTSGQKSREREFGKKGEDQVVEQASSF